MKANLLAPVLFPLALTPSFAQQPVPDEIGKDFKVEPFRKLYQYEGAKPWEEAIGENHPYSAELGFTLWKTPGTELAVVTAIPLFDTPEGKAELEKQVRLNAKDEGRSLTEEEVEAEMEKLKKKMLIPILDSSGKPTDGFKFFDAEEYEKRRLAARLGIFNEAGEESGSAVLFSIRNSFTYFNANQEGMALDYNNTDGAGTLKLKGAVMADIYLDPLYNKRWMNNPFSENTYRFSLRTGVEFDIDDTSTKKTDRTSLYLLGNFQANPDQNAHLLGIDNWWQITSPQFLQVGAALDHDELTGDDDLRWILGWQPRLYVINDRGIFGRTFGINHIMRYEKGEFFKFHKTPETDSGTVALEAPPNESPWYSYLPADIKLTGGSEIWDKLSTGEDLDKASVEWRLGFVLGNSDYRSRFGYMAEGISPLSDIGETHVGHSLFAEIALGNLSKAYATSQEKPKDQKQFVATELQDADLGAVTVFTKYTVGEFAPDFDNEEIFQVGMRLRF